MNKILLVLKREFLNRVQKKTFLLLTIGLPILIFGIYAAIIYFSIKNTTKTNILIVDETHLFKDTIAKNDDVIYQFQNNLNPQEAKTDAIQKGIDGYIIIQPGTTLEDSIQIISVKKIGLVTYSKIQDDINNRLRKLRMNALPIDQSLLEKAKQDNKINLKDINNNHSSQMQAGISYGVGFFCGFLIYLILLLYGTSVMRGVMEEKVNRIAEIMVSSIKPFQLMMGKILGIGAVGLLQFIIWIVLGIGLRMVLIPILFPGIGHSIATSGNAANVQAVLHGLGSINFPLIISMFIIYFLGGYVLYASLFAAIGCSVSDGAQDAQGLQLPITLPIIFAFVIMTQAVNNPNSSLAVFGSLFPLTSPIVMIARIAQGVPEAVPVWQIIVSIILLFASFFLTVWFAGKVYRTGILMYGKKPTWKELIKWAIRKN